MTARIVYRVYTQGFELGVDYDSWAAAFAAAFSPQSDGQRRRFFIRRHVLVGG